MAVKNRSDKSVEEKLQRPPIVAVLGHVDHGKTTLVSKIYQKDLTKKEFGGISQHLGAYQIDCQGKKITFIDTPGHVAFSKMRSRGARVADLVVLVVAADEGVKPQTIESLKHIRTAGIPYLVAINKIDLPGVKLAWVKKNLAENNILVEGYGGDIVTVPVSAKTGDGITQLLEMILLLAEMAELKANPKGELEAVVIESKLDQQKGQIATVLVRDGSLKVGDQLAVGNQQAKIRALFNDRGANLKSAGPGQAVAVLGFKETLPIGIPVNFAGTGAPGEIPITPVETTKEEEGKQLKIILKTDVAGTREAILESFPSEVKVIFSAVGEITESDVFLAATTKAEIIGFNVKLPGIAKKLAEAERVKVNLYQIIYDLLEAIEKKVLKMISPTIDEEILGEAEIIAEFKIKDQCIAGCRVKKGEISKQGRLHLKRGEEIVGSSQIKSMKIGKTDIENAKKGEEFGAVLTGKFDFKVGDVLISYRQAEG